LRLFSWPKFLPLLAVFVVGCTGVQSIKPANHASAETAQINTRLHEILDAAEKRDFPRLDNYHFYGPRFTKFPTEGSRLDAEKACDEEHKGLSMIANLSMQPDDLKIDVFGNVAIATFIMNSSFDAGTNHIQKNARATLVFVRDGGAWKIAHEHFSPFGSRP
jgi:ketosteroid isomerase-like protein